MPLTTKQFLNSESVSQKKEKKKKEYRFEMCKDNTLSWQFVLFYIFVNWWLIRMNLCNLIYIFCSQFYY